MGPRTTKKTGLGRLIGKSKRSKKDEEEIDEEDEIEDKEIDLSEGSDLIQFECDPKTQEPEVRVADVPQLVKHLTHPSHLGERACHAS